MPPRVTVIIPTYNWSSVLPYSIASVLEQTFTDFELLVIGDGCTDDSEQVVRGIGDPRVQWINTPRHGHQSGPNNEGIRVAKGEHIAYLGHDDLWLPHHLEVLVAALDAGADVAHSAIIVVEADGTRDHTTTLVPTASTHRRSMTGVIGGWPDFRDLQVMPEADLWDRAHAAGMRFTFVPRLTGVKLPAAWRKSVYRDKPSHEQAAWLARIRAEPDLERTELVHMSMQRKQPPLTLSQRAVRLITHPWLLPAALWRRIRPQGAIVRTMKRFKGVE